MKYRRWTQEEKLSILALAEEKGIVEACRERGVSTGTFYSWKKKFDSEGEAGLSVRYQSKTWIQCSNATNVAFFKLILSYIFQISYCI